MTIHQSFRRSLPLGQVRESNPTLTILDVLELLHNLFLVMSCRLDRSPELNELLFAHLSITVHIHSVEELLGRDLAETCLPVLDSLLFVNGGAAIDIED